MPKPNLFWDGVNDKWKIRTKNGEEMVIPQSLSFVGTSAAVTIPSGNAYVVGTIVNAYGLKVSDRVFGNPRTALATVLVAGFRIPTTDTLNVYLSGRALAQGSLGVTQWDITAIR